MDNLLVLCLMPRLGGVGKCLCAPGEAKSVLAETGACDTELGRWALKGVSMGLSHQTWGFTWRIYGTECVMDSFKGKCCSDLFFYHQLIGRLLQIFGSFFPVVIATVEFHAGGADYP